MSHFVPELLSPAGSLDKLKIAVNYGANAVYVGGLKFGLRQAADNFTEAELIEGVKYAHDRNALVYVVLNGFLHDKDLDELPEFIKFLESIKIDAVIVSDVGVIKTVIKHTNIPVHVSTQASCLNVEGAKFFKSLGAERIVLGREISIAEAGRIKKEAGIEVELFVHGSMCMAYSGNCVISNFTQGRDSNRGGCAHSCRFEYSLDIKGDEQRKKSFFMSSKDLNGIRVLEEFIKYEIDSIKVEGRMKSHLYAGTMSKVYSEALRYYQTHGSFLSDDLEKWAQELNKVTHRTYAQANLVEKAGEQTIFNEREHDKEQFVMIGKVLDQLDDKMILEVRNAFNENASLEVIPFLGESIIIEAKEIFDLKDNNLQRTKPSTIVKIPLGQQQVETGHIVRMQL